MFGLKTKKEREKEFEIEESRKKKWLEKHTFVYGEKVKVMQGDNVFAEGKVVGFGTHVGFYCAYAYYDVDYGDGQVHRFCNSELEKT